MRPPKIVRLDVTGRRLFVNGVELDATGHLEEAVRACDYYDNELLRVDTWFNRTFMPGRIRLVRELRDLWHITRYDRETLRIVSGNEKDEL